MLEDAAAVLAWLGTPERLVPIVVGLIDRLGDSQVTDALHLALPAAVASALSGDGPEAAFTETAGELFAGARAPFTNIIYFVQAPYERMLAARTDGMPSS